MTINFRIPRINRNSTSLWEQRQSVSTISNILLMYYTVGLDRSSVRVNNGGSTMGKRFIAIFLAMMLSWTLIDMTQATESHAQRQMSVQRHLEDTHTAYQARKGWVYTILVRQAFDECQEPEICITWLQGLIKLGYAKGFDGLEPLLLVFADHIAMNQSDAAKATLAQIIADLQDKLWFRDEPAPQLLMPLRRNGSLLERSVRGEALRAMIESWRDLSAQDASRLSLDSGY